MSLFHQPKPRRFHHEPVYYDEHRDRVSRIEDRARRELRLDGEGKSVKDEIHEAFSSDAVRRRSGHRRFPASMMLANTGALVVIILVLLLIWIYLSR